MPVKHKRTCRHLGINLDCAMARNKPIKLIMDFSIHTFWVSMIQRCKLVLKANSVLLMQSPDYKQYMFTQTLILQKMEI